jgi:DNA-binding transcriptional regulator YhcF (GntR family)
MIDYDLILDTSLMPIGNPTAKVILIALSTYCNAKGHCFPSQQTLANDTLLNVRTVVRAIHWLEDNGYLRVTRQHNKPNFYAMTSMEEDMTNENIKKNVPRHDNLSPEVVSNITKLDIASSSKANTTSHDKLAHPNDTPVFQVFWQSYPRRIGKGAARTAFKKALKFSTADEIIQGATAYAAHCEEMGTEKQYIPHPSTWLNGERWEDDLESEKVETKKTAGWLNEL